MEVVDSSLYLDSYDMLDIEVYDAEKMLNVIGYIPLICVPSGCVRALYGIAQVVVGVVAGIFNLLGDLLRNTPQGYGYRSLRNFSHGNHGVLNVLRGVVEAFTAIGLPTLLYDLIGFRCSYEGELKYKKLQLIHLNQFSRQPQIQER